jgi:lipoate-protein ligase A
VRRHHQGGPAHTGRIGPSSDAGTDAEDNGVPEGLAALAATRGWPLRHDRGSAAEFHRRDVPEATGRALWWFEVARPTVVLGSTQRAETVDAERAAALGVEVVRRRSGAVWLAPGDVTWIDVLLPADDPLWLDDVGRASHWLGETWLAALDHLGALDGLVAPDGLGASRAAVHRGGMVRTPWSDLVCFAGLGPGEVTVDGAKVVGISQRRTRAGARFQCAVLHEWDPVPLLGCCRLTSDDRAVAAADLVERATGTGPIAATTVVAALVGSLPEST